MDDYPINNLPQEIINDYFNEIPKKPRWLFARGTFPVGAHLKFLTVVGSRNHSHYGAEACKKLIAGLRGYPIVIVSGLALGIDTIAHTAALDNGITTIAFPGSGLGTSALYPRSNFFLAEKILKSGGCLISEYNEDQATTPWIFPERNRLLAGVSQATLIIEATNKSGSRITAKFATDYNRDVFAVPGSIFNPQSEGPNELIKLGATPITCAEDILYALGIEPKSHTSGAFLSDQHPQSLLPFISSDLSPLHKTVLTHLDTPLTRGELLAKITSTRTISISELNTLLMEMEMCGLVSDHAGTLYKNK